MKSPDENNYAEFFSLEGLFLLSSSGYSRPLQGMAAARPDGWHAHLRGASPSYHEL